MKKIILGVALLIGASLSAQTYFEDDFTGSLSTANWTSVDRDGDGYKWAYGNFSNAGEVAYSESWSSGVVLTPDNWLVSTAIDLSGVTDDVFLTFKAWGVDPDYANEKYEVYAGTSNDVEVLVQGAPLFATTATANEDEHSIDLSSFAGQTIHIAFRHYGTSDVFVLALDDVKVSTPAENDLAIVSAGADKLIVGDRVFSVEIENNGTTAATAFDVKLTFDGLEQTKNVTGVNLGFGQTHTVDFNVNVANPGPVAVNVELIYDDEDQSNNTLGGQLEFHPNIPNYVQNDINGNPFDLHERLSGGQAIVLDFMASWCGPCLQSTPAISKFIEDNGAGQGVVEALAITVEETDNASVLAGLDWNGGYYSYPKFAYSGENAFQYVHYSVNHELNTGWGIPFFVMICPNIEDPGNSEIVKYDVGYGNGMFNAYQTALDQCPTTVDVIELPQDFTFVTYPNPASSTVNVEFNLQAENNVEVTVINAVGQTVAYDNLGKVNGAQSVQLDVSSLQAGMYIVKVRTGNIEKTQRISLM